MESTLIQVMLFDVTNQSFSESDYETAVDLRHYNSSTDTAKFRTPYGLEFHIEEEQVTTTGSYLEPDFNWFEETKEVVYLTYDDPTADEETHRKYVHFFLPGKIEQKSIESLWCDHSDDDDYQALNFRDSFILSSEIEMGDLEHLSIYDVFTSVLVPTKIADLIRRHEKELQSILEHNRSMMINNNCTEALYEIKRLAQEAYAVFQ